MKEQIKLQITLLYWQDEVLILYGVFYFTGFENGWGGGSVDVGTSRELNRFYPQEDGTLRGHTSSQSVIISKTSWEVTSVRLMKSKDGKPINREKN